MAGCAIALFGFTTLAAADQVVPTDEVVSRVVVRASASSSSPDVGSLRPGEQAELLGSVPNWLRVRLTNGIEGFVSKRWTRVVSSAPASTTGATFQFDAVDVGTGLGLLIRGPDFTLVYDAGSNDDRALGADNRFLAYARAIAPAVTTVDHVVLSHPHRDHVELLPDVFSAYSVRHVWDSGRLNTTCGYKRFLVAVRDEPGVEYHTALQDGGSKTVTFPAMADCSTDNTVQLNLASRISNEPIVLGQNATMQFLYIDGASHSSPNENSLVTLLDLGGTRILLMGDAEAGGRKPPSSVPTPTSIEGALLACCAADLSARVLVVGHHGSMTSSRRAFLDAVGASVFVVSSGPFPYGAVTLPDQVVIDELTSRGQVFRTDVDDAACRASASKVGTTSDNKPGGCDAIRIVIKPAMPLEVSVWHGVN